MSEQALFILGKWKDPSYRGCFSGITNLTNVLNSDFSMQLKQEDVIEALKHEPAFVNRIGTNSNPERRRYDVRDGFDTWHLDLAFLKKYRKFIGFLICLLYTSPSPRDQRGSRMPSSA